MRCKVGMVFASWTRIEDKFIRGNILRERQNENLLTSTFYKTVVMDKGLKKLDVYKT